jgi:hypothetical protein
MQGDFGEKWLCAVASGCGLHVGPTNWPDTRKTDLMITYPGELNQLWDPAIKVQVKTSQGGLRLLEGDATMASYQVDIDTYDVLRKTNHFIPMVLIVFGVAPEGQRVRLEQDGTLLVGRGLWVSLAGSDAKTTASVAVRLPLANTVDGPGLLRMLQELGVSRSSPVEEVS